jgi:hypothetical protein
MKLAGELGTKVSTEKDMDLKLLQVQLLLC